MTAPCGRRGAFGSYRWRRLISQTVIVSDPVQVSQICDGKSPLSQPALIVSNPVRISQICDGKSPLSQPALIMSDPVQVSQICDGKWPAEGGFSVTNLGNLDKIRHDQGFLAEGDFPSRIWEIWTGSNTIRAGWLRGIFRHEFGKSGQDQTRSGLAG